MYMQVIAINRGETLSAKLKSIPNILTPSRLHKVPLRERVHIPPNGKFGKSLTQVDAGWEGNMLYTLPKTNSLHLKVSFGNGLLSGAMLVLGCAAGYHLGFWNVTTSSFGLTQPTPFLMDKSQLIIRGLRGPRFLLLESLKTYHFDFVLRFTIFQVSSAHTSSSHILTLSKVLRQQQTSYS